MRDDPGDGAFLASERAESMPEYDITVSRDGAGCEYRVVLRGPGIETDGRPYVFATPNRCSAFIEAVNFAYQQGLRDGMRRKRETDESVLIVRGTTPDNMTVRVEGRWERWKRRWRNGS